MIEGNHKNTKIDSKVISLQREVLKVQKMDNSMNQLMLLLTLKIMCMQMTAVIIVFRYSILVSILLPKRTSAASTLLLLLINPDYD